MKAGHTKILIIVNGGNVQGARSNNADAIVEVFDMDNLVAEGKTGKQIERMLKTKEKKYTYFPDLLK